MLEPTNQNDWKTQMYIRGGLIGLLVGLIAAHLYTRASQEANEGTVRTPIAANDMVKVGLTILGLVRQITELGNTKN